MKDIPVDELVHKLTYGWHLTALIDFISLSDKDKTKAFEDISLLLVKVCRYYKERNESNTKV